MKKYLSIFLSMLCLLFLFTACSKDLEGEGDVQGTPEPTPTPKVYFQHPLTGEEKTADYPQGKSPVAVMVNNIMNVGTQNAWPQYGLSDADVVYEMETEGGITRYMAVFSDYANLPKVGPVRSARDQFVQLMIPMQALYAHVGGSVYAKNMLNEYGWADRDIDGYSKSITFLDEQRLQIREREHCSFTNGTYISNAIGKFNLSDENKERNLFEWVKYDQPARLLNDGVAEKMYWRFSTIYDTFFTYNTANKTYTKEHRYIPGNYQKPLVDANYGDKPVEFDNVLVLWTQIERYPDRNKPSGLSSLSKVDMAFGGIGYYFSQGTYEKVRWIKGVPTDYLKIVDTAGHEKDIEINTGKTYVAFVDLDYFGTFKINEQLIDTAGDYTPPTAVIPEDNNQEEKD